MAEAKRRLPLWIRAAIGFAAATLALGLAGVGLRYWITSDSGRAFIASQIDGRRLGSLGVIRVSGFMGDPLTTVSVADIALVDDDGIWLRARDAKIAWTPFKLLSGNLDIQTVDVRTIDVLRRPRSAEKRRNNGSPDIGLTLDALTIHELKLAEGIVGQATAFSINGGAARAKSGSGFGRLEVRPLAGSTDTLQANAEWSATGALAGRISANGPAGGVIATLLEAPSDAAVGFSANLAGTPAAFKGDARLSFGATPALTMDVSRTGDTAKLRATLAVDGWALLDPVAGYAGGAIAIDATTKLADPNRAPVTISVSAPAGEIVASADVNLEQMKLVSSLQLAANHLDLAHVAEGLNGRVSARGTARIGAWNDWSWRGEARADGLLFPGGASRRAAGPVNVGMSGNAVSWETSGLTLDGARLTPLKALKPDTYTLITRGEYNLRTHLVEIHQSQIAGRPGAVSARGHYSIRTHELDMAGGASIARLSDLAPLSGSARGQWTVRQASTKSPIRVTIAAAGRDVRSTVPALAQLFGDAPAVTLNAVASGGRFVIESGALSGGALEARMTGRVANSGDLSGHVSGRLGRALNLGAATIHSLDFTADLAGTASAPRIDLQAGNGSLAFAGMAFTGLAGSAQASLGKAPSGNFSLDGSADGQTLKVGGRFDGSNGAYRLKDMSARLADLTIVAPQLTFDHGDMAASFRISGSLAGIEGITRGTLAAQGQAALKDNRLQLTASGEASNVRRGEFRILQASLDAHAANDTAKLAGKLTGQAGAKFDLAFGATAARAADAWSGQATLNGTVDDQALATREPIEWSYGASGWSAGGRLSAFGGQIDASAAEKLAHATSKITLTDLDMLALTRLVRISPISGRISGASTFSNANGAASADLDLRMVDANPSGVTSDPIGATITGRLRDGRLRASMAGSGQGFRLDAGAVIPIDVGSGFKIEPARDKPIEADLSVSGRAEQLWALFGPEGQSLRGAVDANIKIAGTLAAPTLAGGFDIANGVYEHGETGFRLRNIKASGVFDQTSAHVTQLTADDGASGRLTALGDIDWRKDIQGGVRFTATDLKALGRDDRSATVSGQGAIRLQPDAVVVSGDLHIAQARISIEQPAAAAIPILPYVRRINFPQVDSKIERTREPARPVRLDLKVAAPRRVVVFGRGLDTEWSADFHVTGSTSDPSVDGTATLVRGTLDLAGRRFDFDSGSVRMDGPIRNARVDISATRDAADVDATVHVTGSPVKPVFTLGSTPALPQDEILSRVIFGKSASQLSALEAAQLAAGLAQLAGGQAAFDPSRVVREATGLDRVAFGATDGAASVSAGKYITDDVYLQVGAGGTGGVGAQVEWEPRKNLSITSGAQASGDTRLAVRWKKDY